MISPPLYFHFFLHCSQKKNLGEHEALRQNLSTLLNTKYIDISIVDYVGIFSLYVFLYAYNENEAYSYVRERLKMAEYITVICSDLRVNDNGLILTKQLLTQGKKSKNVELSLLLWLNKKRDLALFPFEEEISNFDLNLIPFKWSRIIFFNENATYHHIKKSGIRNYVFIDLK